MRLVSYMAGGVPDYGVVVGDGVVGMRKRLGFPTLRDALTPEGLAAIRATATDIGPDHKLSDIHFLPVVPNPEKIVCAGINYRAHAAETGVQAAE